jgi:hypothetical protein
VFLFGCEQLIGIADGVADEFKPGRLALGDDIEADQRLDVMRQDWTQWHWKTPANSLTVRLSRVAGVEDSYADKHRWNHPKTHAWLLVMKSTVRNTT